MFNIREWFREFKTSIKRGRMIAETSDDLPEAVGRAKGIAQDNRAQGSNLSGLIIGIAVAAIVGVGVGIPIINDVIASSNLTGITATVVGFIPIMLGLLIFVATASPIMRRT